MAQTVTFLLTARCSDRGMADAILNALSRLPKSVILDGIMVEGEAVDPDDWTYIFGQEGREVFPGE